MATAGRPVLYFTLEEARQILVAKTIARVGAIDYSLVLRGAQSARQQIDAVRRVLSGRQSTDLLRYADDSHISLDELRLAATAHFEQYGQSGLLVPVRSKPLQHDFSEG